MDLAQAAVRQVRIPDVERAITFCRDARRFPQLFAGPPQRSFA